MGHLEIQKPEHKSVLLAPGMLAASREHDGSRAGALLYLFSTVKIFWSIHSICLRPAEVTQDLWETRALLKQQLDARQDILRHLN